MTAFDLPTDQPEDSEQQVLDLADPVPEPESDPEFDGSYEPTPAREPEAESSTPRLVPLEIQVTRSKRRKKTAEAKLRGNVVDIRIPAASSGEDEQHFVDHFVAKFEKHRRSAMVDLSTRAQNLADEYSLPFPDSIRWVSNQNQRWGSCTPADGAVRLSDRLAGFPTWVIDYVIVHELAHLVEIDHNEAFWALVEPYTLAERARGYLIAKAELPVTN